MAPQAPPCGPGWVSWSLQAAGQRSVSQPSKGFDDLEDDIAILIPQKYWAIRCKTFYMKSPNPIGWPYLTFVTKQAAQDYITETPHRW
jgi:hypothetical protein